MGFSSRVVVSLLCVCIVFSAGFACSEKKEGKVVVTQQDYSLRHDGKNSYSLDVTGKIKNVGETDLKNVMVTGYCRSCDEVVLQGRWFVNDLEKTPIQQDTLAYLAAGDEEAFNFKEVAYYWAEGAKAPDTIPEAIEVISESFEVVQ